MHPDPRSLIRALPTLGLLLLAVPAWAAFTDNNDGTVTDTETGLMWDKCSWDQTWTGPLPDDTNTCEYAASTYQWAAALGLAVIANGDNHRDYNDWRLPNKNELESLVDITRSSPAIDPAFPDTPNWFYWSSTTYAPVPAYAWYVDFFNGLTVANALGSGSHVRLVRSGQSFDPSDLFGSLITATASPAGGGTVTCAPNPVSSGGRSICTAAPNPGYRFGSWSGACSGSTNPCLLENVTAPRSVTARFTSTGGEPIPGVGPWGLSLLTVLLAGLAGLQLRRLRGSRR